MHFQIVFCLSLCVTKVKAYAKPPEAVMKTMCAVMTVMEKTPSWGQAKEQFQEPTE